MSTEPEQPIVAESDNGVTGDPPVPVAPTSPPNLPPPPPPTPPSTPIIADPFTWYSVESACTTTDCTNLNIVYASPMAYSNAGTLRVICGLCGKDMLIVSATKLDPQPEFS